MPSNTLVCFRLVCFFLQRLIQPFFINFWASQKQSLWTTSQGGSPQASDTVKPNGSSLEMKLWNLLPKNTVNKVCSVHIQRLKFAGFWMFCLENIYFSVCSNIYFFNLFHSFGASKQSILNYWLYRIFWGLEGDYEFRVDIRCSLSFCMQMYVPFAWTCSSYSSYSTLFVGPWKTHI